MFKKLIESSHITWLVACTLKAVTIGANSGGNE